MGSYDHKTAACILQGLPMKLQGSPFCFAVSTKEAVGYLKTCKVLAIFLCTPDGLDKIQGVTLAMEY